MKLFSEKKFLFLAMWILITSFCFPGNFLGGKPASIEIRKSISPCKGIIGYIINNSEHIYLEQRHSKIDPVQFLDNFFRV
ncbi:MAG: hypothetical protein CMG74_04095 [Candidatus Marinimicrobia bacterium]|nr:hypothetical protein [Candidatus Neomarinimicrobiota bacterium]